MSAPTHVGGCNDRCDSAGHFLLGVVAPCGDHHEGDCSLDCSERAAVRSLQAAGAWPTPGATKGYQPRHRADVTPC